MGRYSRRCPRAAGGALEHRDSILTGNEQEADKSIFLCVSRCRSGTLVLDL
jgi:tetrachlorobenzoquinone reductase